MFNAILLVGSDSTCAAVEYLAAESKLICFQKALTRFPQAFELSKILNTLAPDLVFLDLSVWESALAAAADIHQLSPHTPIIGFGAGWEPGIREQCLSVGVTELLVSPVTLETFRDSVDRAIHRLQGAPRKNLLAFLPAKAGSGSTTIALNTAGYLADPSLHSKTLLIEGDLRSGVLSVLLDIHHTSSVEDALANSEQLDYSRWSGYVAQAHGLDLLLAPCRKMEPLPSWANYHHLLSFADSRYDSILVDLPEVVNDATVEVVRRAERIFVVCTPELASLALTPLRCEELTSRGIPAENISIIVNRWHRGEISAAEVQEIVKYPVSAMFPNDYAAVSNASRGRAFVNPETKVGKSFSAFARKLAGVQKAPNSSKVSFFKGLGERMALQPRV